MTSWSSRGLERTPEASGLPPHHTSPPRHPEEFAGCCAEMVRRYAR